MHITVAFIKTVDKGILKFLTVVIWEHVIQAKENCLP